MAALICSVGNFNGAIAKSKREREGETGNRTREAKGIEYVKEKEKEREREEERKRGRHLEGSPNSSMINTFVYVHVLSLNRIESRLYARAIMYVFMYQSNQTAIQNGKSVRELRTLP